MEQVNRRAHLHNMLGPLPVGKFRPLPRLTGSRILCHIRSFQMSLSCPKMPISDGAVSSMRLSLTTLGPVS
jgi:hypothetical protein